MRNIKLVLVEACWLAASAPCTAQTVVASARVICATPDGTSGPIEGAVINQTNTPITDLEVELSIITRDKKGVPKRHRDTRFVILPSINQTGMVTRLEPNADVYFSIPGKERGSEVPWPGDLTCGLGWQADKYSVLNIAAIAITRINGRPMLPAGKDGKPMKQAPLETMLQVPRYAPERVPTEQELVREIMEKNALLRSTIIHNQLQDCLSRGTWACTFNNDTNINVVISQK